MFVDCILPEKKEEKGLISSEYVNIEVQSLDKYLSESKEWMLKFVAGEKGLSKVEDPDAFKKRLKEEKGNHWLEKRLHGRFLKDTKKVSRERTWQWLKGGHLKKETEAMVCSAQKEAPRVNSIKHHIERQDTLPMCSLCVGLSETVMHLSSGWSVLSKMKYQIQHDIVRKHITWLFLKKHGIPTRNKWYCHVPSVVAETDNGEATIYWDKTIKADRKVSYNMPDVVVIDRKDNAIFIVDFEIPTDHPIKEKEEKKIYKGMDFTAGIRRQLRVTTVIVPIVLGALGTVATKLSESFKKVEIEDVIESLQTAASTSIRALLRSVSNLKHLGLDLGLINTLFLRNILKPKMWFDTS